MSENSYSGAPFGTQMIRLALVGLGVLAIARGAYLVLSFHLQFQQLRSIVLWLAAGSVLHDLFIGPLSVLLGRVLRRPLRSPITGNAVRAAWLAFGTTLVIGLPLIGGSGRIPLLGGTGRRANPTVIPGRPVLSMALALALLVAGVALAAGLSVLLHRRQSHRPPKTSVE